MTAAARIDKAAARRRAQLAAIHIAASRLRLDRATYEAVLYRVSGASSAAKLDAAGRARVLDELRRLAGDGARQARDAVPPPHAPHRVRPETAAMVGKVGAVLAEAGRDWNYAHGVARHMFHVQRVEWLTVDQLRRLVTALVIDRTRRKARTANAMQPRSDHDGD